MSSIWDLDTPIPVVDVGRLEANLGRMAARIAANGVGHLPHTKAHKTAEVARRQLAHGAAGLTVAKLGEAEALIEAGFDDLFMAYPLVGRVKLERLLPMLDRATLRFTVDLADGARGASAIIGRAGRTADVVIEVEAGAGRTGVPTIDDALRLGALIDELPGLRLAGVMAHAPGYVEGAAAQRAMGHAEGGVAVRAAAALCAAGHAVLDIVTAGCTPTSPYAAEVPGVTHVRAGNYVYHDCKQVQLGVATWDDCALTVLATVVSAPQRGRYVLDAGMKALAGEDYGWGTYGRILGRPDIVLSWVAEEHGIIDLEDGVEDPRWRIGDLVRVIPDHACGVSNMHDRVIAVDGERVLEQWRTIGRGRVQ